MSVMNGLYIGSSQGDELFYNNEASGLESSNMQGAIDEIAALNRMIPYDYTLQASNWEGTSAPFTYRVTLDKINETDNVYIAPGKDITMVQYDIIQDAVIDIVSQGDGYIELVARGEKPTIDIPTILMVGQIITIPDGRDATYIEYHNPAAAEWLNATTVGDALDAITEKLQDFKPEGQAAGILIDDTEMQLGVTNVQEAIEKIVEGGIGGGTGSIGARTHNQITIRASAWLGDTAPYLNTITMEGVTPDTDMTIGAVYEMTMDQYQALANASIVAGSTTEGRIVLKAFGSKPTIDLPVDIIRYN